MVQVPREWVKMAEKHNGVIAGGCLRDLLLGKPVKDVDIYVPGLTDMNPEYFKGFSHEEVELNGTHYDLVHHRFTAFNFMDTFDTGICRVAYHPQEVFRNPWEITPEFVHDAVNRKITVLLHSLGWEKHVARVCAKYPEFELVDEVEEGLDFCSFN